MRSRALTSLIALLPMVVAYPAHADPVRCKATIVKESSKHVQAVMKALQRCEDRKVTGSLPASTDCSTDPATSTAVQKADARLSLMVNRRCGGPDATCGTADDDSLASIGWNVGTCPNLEQGSCTNPISSCAGVGTCLVCVGDAAARQAIALYYAADQQGQFGTGSAVNRCHRAIGKETARFLNAKSKALAQCWGARIKGRHNNPCPTPGDGKAAGRIAAAELRKRTRICAACGGADGTCGGGDDLAADQIGFVSSCLDVTVPGGASCSATVTNASNIVDCVDCVSEFKADCADRLAVPEFTSYPSECNSTTTTTTTSTTISTTTTTAAPCPPPPVIPLGTLTFTIGQGTTDCGSAGFLTLPATPFSGEVDNGGSKASDLGLGCLYVGGGNSTLIPGAPIPDGGSSVLAVAGVSGLAITVTASPGSGPADCTQGAGPGRHCLNDGVTACTSDADCGGKVGACDLDANCFFGTPVPVSLGPLSVCIMNGVASDVCGSANLLTNTTSVSAALSARAYVTGDAASPCPICDMTNHCSAGANAGGMCSGGVGSAKTTIECPPKPSQFFGRLDINLSSLSTGTSTLTDPAGNFCPAQAAPGAFGIPATLVSETGTPLLSGGGLFNTTLAGTFCVPASGNPFFDSTAGVPGPGAVSVPGTIAVNLLP